MECQLKMATSMEVRLALMATMNFVFVWKAMVIFEPMARHRAAKYRTTSIMFSTVITMKMRAKAQGRSGESLAQSHFATVFNDNFVSPFQ